MKRTPLNRKTPLKAKTGLSRKTRLRPVSKSTAKKRTALAPYRVWFKGAVGYCDCCGEKFPAGELDIHEITAGASRQRAEGNPRLWMVLCRPCHELKVQGAPFGVQLAMLLDSIRKHINCSLGRNEL